jgi:nucleoside 2-deoxyribosyltransferase
VANEISDIRNGFCPICRLQNPILQRTPEDNPALQLHCARCDDYDITYKAASELNDLHPNSPIRPRIAEWVWEQRSLGITPKISTAVLPTLLVRRTLPFLDRAKRLLTHLADRTTTLGANLSYSDFPPITAMLQTFNLSEVAAVATFLDSQRWIDHYPTAALVKMLGAGFIQAENWKATATQSAQGFVAMWFDDTTAEAWEYGLRKGITDAGYQPIRIDKTEHVNKICDEIVAQIRRSRFVVADYTGHRAGVYYEAGYAAGREIPVIPTCRKNEIDKLHFDVRQFNCIDWQTPAELAERLKARIEAHIGDGPFKRGN